LGKPNSNQENANALLAFALSWASQIVIKKMQTLGCRDILATIVGDLMGRRVAPRRKTFFD
jgi:hypothetical protein